MANIKVFISYCHEEVISRRAVNLSDMLRNDGIDCEIDQYELYVEEGWPKWMEKKIMQADFILLLCTKKLYERIYGKDNKGEGVQFESTLVYHYILQNKSKNKKVIPIIFNYLDRKYIPEILKSFSFYNLNDKIGYVSLLRTITNQPRYVKKDIPKNFRHLPPENEEFSDLLSSTNNDISIAIDNKFYEFKLILKEGFKPSNRDKQDLLKKIDNLLDFGNFNNSWSDDARSLNLILFEEQVTELSHSFEVGEFQEYNVVDIAIGEYVDIKIYCQDELMQASLKYFKGDDLAARVWVNKYALKDSFGNLIELTPDDMHRRLTKEIVRIEQRYPNPLTEAEIYGVLKDFKYIVPQGGPMTGIGNDYQIGSLSNCFVVGNDENSDSYGVIMKIDQELVQLMKRRGAAGHDLSHIRPKGSHMYNSDLTSIGIVPFMERYSNSTREAAQDGRRGALMLTVSIKHPDSENFIDAKLEQGKVTGANVSVKLPDDFMRAVEAGNPYIQQYPISSPKPRFTKKINARDLWSKIVKNAWKSAEPGILFWDNIINESIPDCYADLGYRTVSTNPCGEIPLCPYDSCRLLAINLYSYVDQPFTKQAKFNFELFKEHVHYAQRIMDDIIDLELEKIDAILDRVNADPEDEYIKFTEKNLWENIKRKATESRRTGINITGEGDMLAALGLRYGSEIATDFSEEIHKTTALEAYRSSVYLAKDRGPFTIYSAKREKNNPMINRIKNADPVLYEKMVKYGRRNIALLTIAPTGTTSLMTQTTSGIEPVFLPVYKRRRKVNPGDKDVRVDFTDESGDTWEEYIVFHHKFKTWMEANGYETNRDYSQEELNELVKVSPYFKATSNDVDWLAKVRMQGRIQKWVDHSISVTINLPADAKKELVGELFFEAWKTGCKGVTVYRDGSRSGVLISNDEPKDKKKGGGFPTKRPEKLEADVVRFQNNKDKWIAFVGLLDNRPYEIFTCFSDNKDGIFLPHTISKGLIIKSCEDEENSRYDFQYINSLGYKTTIEGLSHKFNPVYWNYAKLISGTLRHGMPIHKVVDLVTSMKLDNETINSWKAGVARALKKYIPDGTIAEDAKCLECGSEEVIYKEGCLTCISCGSTKCG